MFRIKVLCTCTSRLIVNAERLSFLSQTKWLFVGANLKRNFSYLKARTRSLSPVTWKQPSNVRSFISRRHRWCFTALCWTRADNYKKLQLPLKIPKLALIFPFFFLYKASFVPAQTSLKSLSPGRACLLRRGPFIQNMGRCASPAALWVPLLSADSRTPWQPFIHRLGGFQTANTQTGSSLLPPTVMYTQIRL